MIPIHDENPQGSRAVVTFLIIILCAVVYLLLQPRGDIQEQEFLYRTAAIPCEVTTGDPLSFTETQTGICADDDETPLFPHKSTWISLVTTIFLHGDLFHLISNLWILAIFGNNVEFGLGRLRFISFYVFAGIGASLAHVFANPTSTIPLVGASGAIAGLMGVYLVFYPKNRVVTVIPPFVFWPFHLPAVVFLAFWFIGQFGLGATNIAWEAHVGGFVLGVLYALFLRGSRRVITGYR